MASPRSSLCAAVVAAGTLAAGCGTTGLRASSNTGARRPAAAGSRGPGADSGAQAIPSPAPTGVAAGPAAVRVIRGWSAALRRGDVRVAARYFALPSQMINGTDSSGQPLVIAIRTRGQAEAADATLPCGAQLLAADQRGRYVNALFRLTDRPGPGGGCGSGTGQTARTNFVISGGRIVEWIRAPDDPGDGGAAPPSPAVPATPSQSSGPTV